MSAATPTIRTLADLLGRLGVPADRVRFHPSPGTATLQDVLDVKAAEGRLCELVEGVLVEKAMGFPEAYLAGCILAILKAFVAPLKLGIVVGADGAMAILSDLVRIPDVSFIGVDRLPERRLPADQIPRLCPDLAVEVLSPSNTAEEMSRKRQEYFAAGTRLVWEVEPESRTVTVYSSPDQGVTLTVKDTLDGGTVLPGFALPLASLFAELDFQG